MKASSVTAARSKWINNAKRVQKLLKEGGSLARLVWRSEPAKRTRRPQTASNSPKSIALSKDLQKRGWQFVGPTTVYAFMQATGLIKDHVNGCIIQARVERAARCSGGRGTLTRPAWPPGRHS